MVPPLKKFFAVLCLGMMVCAPVWGQQINNLDKWAESGFDEVSPFGIPNWTLGPDKKPLKPFTPTYGQTFEIPDGFDQITSFAFQLRSLGNGDVRFVAYLSAWDVAEGRLIGNLLYTSKVTTLYSAVTAPLVAGDFISFEFSLPTLGLDPTKTYVAFLSTSGLLPDPLDGSAAVGSPNEGFSTGGGAAFTGGRFVYFNNDDLAILSMSKWQRIEAGDEHIDAAFAANFSRSSQLVAVPEPGTYGLLAALTLGGAVLFRRFWARAKL